MGELNHLSSRGPVIHTYCLTRNSCFVASPSIGISSPSHDLQFPHCRSQVDHPLSHLPFLMSLTVVNDQPLIISLHHLTAPPLFWGCFPLPSRGHSLPSLRLMLTVVNNPSPSFYDFGCSLLWRAAKISSLCSTAHPLFKAIARRCWEPSPSPRGQWLKLLKWLVRNSLLAHVYLSLLVSDWCLSKTLTWYSCFQNQDQIHSFDWARIAFCNNENVCLLKLVEALIARLIAL